MVDRLLLNVRVLLALGCLFHVAYLFPVFDIYFRSPLVHGPAPEASPLPPPATRLVFIVADGLRADRLFETDPPFLGRLIRERAVAGISHAHVPTESRPGHVAMFAGIYEDPSAVTTGWKANAVGFETIFDYTSSAWAFGNRDITALLEKPASPQIETDSYGVQRTEFAGDLHGPDDWSIDRVGKLLAQANRDPALDARLRADRTMIFVHLLGMDLVGHRKLPGHPVYESAIRRLDAGVAELVRHIEEFYGHDGRTAFIFTSDHGMSDRGSHGDGDPACTQTPLIAWGAGLSGPQVVSGAAAASMGGKYGQLKRRDVEQADLCPLMAALLGIPTPLNSVGVLPRAYLKFTPAEEAEACLANARQFYRQAKLGFEQASARARVPLPGQSSLQAAPALIDSIRGAIGAGEFERAIRLSDELMALSLESARVQRFFARPLMLGLVFFAFTGWMGLAALFLVPTRCVTAPGPLRFVNALFISGTTVVFLALWLVGAPPQYYFYVVFPIFFWREIAIGWASLTIPPGRWLCAHWVRLLWLFVGLELIVLAFYQRAVFSVIFLGLAATAVYRARSSRQGWPWAIGCLVLAPSTILPIGKILPGFVVVAALILTVIAILAAFPKSCPALSGTWTGRVDLSFLVVGLCVLAAIYPVLDSHAAARVNRALSSSKETIALLLCAFSLSSLLWHRSGSRDTERLTKVFLSLAPMFILLSVAFEGLFYIALGGALIALIHRETSSLASDSDSCESVNLRLIYLLLLLVSVAIHGTGNIASLGSFDLAGTFRFTTKFRPYLMTSLLVWKLCIPMIVIVAAFIILARRLGKPPILLMVAGSMLADVITLTFFFLIRSTGSWREIGESLSRFVIFDLLIAGGLAMYGLCRFFLGRPPASPPPLLAV